MERQDSLAHRGSGAPQSPHHTQTWHFMVINNPHTARSAPSRRTVRSHAMRNYHQRTRDAVARGTRPIRPQEFELDVDKLLERSVHRPIQEANREIELYGHRKIVRHSQSSVNLSNFELSFRPHMYHVSNNARHWIFGSRTTNCSFPSATSHVIVASDAPPSTSCRE